MSHQTFSLSLSLSVALFLSLVVSPASAQVVSVRRISNTPGGDIPNGSSDGAVVSQNGSFVAFQSGATDLVTPLESNPYRDIYLRDVIAGTTTRITNLYSSTSETSGDSGSIQDSSRAVRISADGRFVAFESEAPDIVLGDSNGLPDVYLYDRQTSETEYCTLDENNFLSSAGGTGPAVSNDGQYCAFNSQGVLSSSDDNGLPDVYARFLGSDLTILMSQESPSGPGNGYASDATISGNGAVVAFSSDSTNFAAGDTNGVADIFVRNIAASTTTRVSLSSKGVEGNATSTQPALSHDGRYVAFASTATNLSPLDTNGVIDVFLRDTVAGTTELISVTADNRRSGADGSTQPSISADGRYVAFLSFASDLVKGDTNGVGDIFVRDRFTQTTVRASMRPGGQITAAAKDASISPDGHFVVFSTDDGSLTPGDTNSLTDVFLVEIQTSLTPGTAITAPPEVLVEPKRATVNMLRFKKFTQKKKARSLPVAAAARAAARPVPTKVEWRLTLTGMANGKRITKKAVSKKNTFTFKNLPSGSYTVTYKVAAVQGTRTVFATKPSPSKSFNIGA